MQEEELEYIEPPRIRALESTTYADFLPVRSGSWKAKTVNQEASRLPGGRAPVISPNRRTHIRALSLIFTLSKCDPAAPGPSNAQHRIYPTKPQGILYFPKLDRSRELGERLRSAVLQPRCFVPAIRSRSGARLLLPCAAVIDSPDIPLNAEAAAALQTGPTCSLMIRLASWPLEGGGVRLKQLPSREARAVTQRNLWRGYAPFMADRRTWKTRKFADR